MTRKFGQRHALDACDAVLQCDRAMNDAEIPVPFFQLVVRRQLQCDRAMNDAEILKFGLDRDIAVTLQCDRAMNDAEIDRFKP